MILSLFAVIIWNIRRNRLNESQQQAQPCLFPFPDSILDVILKRKKKKNQNYRTKKLIITFVKAVGNRCFSFKHFKALKSPCRGLGKRFLTWEKPLHFPGPLILPSPASPLLEPNLWYFTQRAGPGARGRRNGWCTEKQPGPQRANPGIFPMHGKETNKRPGLWAASLHPAQAALEEPISSALYFQSRSLLAERLCPERSRCFAPSFYD